MPPLAELSPQTLGSVRKVLAGIPAPLGLDDDGIEVQELVIPVQEGPELRALLYLPPERGSVRTSAILNLHGGGFVAGTAQREDAASRQMSRYLGCVVLVPDYRLAPEWPYPAALDDASAALCWLREQAPSLGVDPARIALRGVSAGGGLAAGLALRCRDRRSPRLRGLSLVFPMLDDRTRAHEHCGRWVWTASANRFAWNAYLKDLDPGAVPDCAAPARARNLSGLPPTFLACGSIDLFAAENLAFAARLLEAGNTLEMHLYPGAYHGFPLVPQARCSQALVRDSLNWMSRQLNDEPWGDRP